MKKINNNSSESHTKWPSKKQWLHFFKILGKKERILFSVLFTIFTLSSIFLIRSFYVSHTEIVPDNYGRIKEGVLGQPQFINPLYAPLSDVDRDLSELVFSSLMTYDKNGNIVPDLISEYKMEENEKNVEISIKENVKWHDNKPLTIDDVIFTIDLVQDPEYLSPLRTMWQGIEIEKLSEYKALFKLKQSYSGFEEVLVSLKILPKHIWKDFSVQAMTSNRALNIMSPIGSGPYIISKTIEKNDKTIKSMILSANKNYYGDKPHIQRIDFYFFNSQEELLNNLKKGNLDSGNIENPVNYEEKKFKKYNLESMDTPNYFTLFINNQKKPLSEIDVRQALTLLTNKQEIINQVLNNNGKIMDSPIIPNFFGFNQPKSTFSFDEEKGKQMLDKAQYTLKDGTRIKTIEKSNGFQFKQTLQYGNTNADVKKLQECLSQDPEIYPSQNTSGYFGNDTKNAVIKFQEKYKDDILVPAGIDKGTGKVAGATIKKLNEICFTSPSEEIPLSFVLKTTNHPTLIKTAQMIKEQWEKQGIKVEIQTVDGTEIKKVIRERDFELLLFGERLGGIPDLIPFWHSSQRIDPGLNISFYENKKADELMEKARRYSDYKDSERSKTLEDLQDVIISDSPSIFLYTTNYLYLMNKNIKGFETDKIIEPSKRFVNVENWFIKEKRIWKWN
ncbi:MAG: ABC transporter substrate-binding protein [Candidatus Pacebacteria bacterium]|nr:ABC transporter substrate-binding protein [Candidatus Paceibacterota bacterium]